MTLLRGTRARVRPRSAPRRCVGVRQVSTGCSRCAALALALIGAVLVWAATRQSQLDSGGNPNAFLYRHLINVVLSAGLVFVASRLDARLLRMSGPIVYVAALFGLLLVFPAGVTINGAHAWIQLAPRLRGAAVGVHEARPDRRARRAVHRARQASRSRAADLRRHGVRARPHRRAARR